ncbi:hypothetical protein [Actinokineospora bangkokensis]|uniref:Uncharacterized protein n=1 Tax=Actinokineospora bangkokensis TaxID=1193682 RepID=A0A1Q9LH79_9PSEU|nr:hypothetical protein [Actinokineospora bangkokensis]OLR91402.1 hypothetical protein BJP25_00730 [Actinokineospora bangkokensis]
MTESRRVLVLHLATGGEPLVFALSPRAGKSLLPRLAVLMGSGGVESTDLEDGTSVAINFGHVVSAHFDSFPGNARVYGVPQRQSGFGG